jgi:Arm domain-containing DNA-binding protein
LAKLNLTDRTLASLCKSGEQSYHYDATVTGLVARPKPSGGGALGFRYALDSKTSRLTIGDWPVISLAEARRRTLGFRKALADGLDPSGKAQKTRSAETIAEAVEEYVETHLKPRLKAWALPASTLRDKLVSALGHKKLADVTRAEVRSEAHEVSQDRTRLRHRYLGHMSAFFGWMIRNDVGRMGERSNPAEFVYKPGGPEGPKTAPSALRRPKCCGCWSLRGAFWYRPSSHLGDSATPG